MPYLADTTRATSSESSELVQDSEPAENAEVQLSDTNYSQDWLDVDSNDRPPKVGALPPSRKRKREECYVQVSGLTNPKSQYESIDSLVTGEGRAIEEFREKACAHQGILQLDDFSIYVPEGSRYSGDMRCLHQLRVEDGANELLLDGVIGVNGESRHVQGVRFGCLSIEGYDTDSEEPSANLHVYIQSCVGAKRNVWYQLGSPALEYQRYHDPFLWIARLTKYLISFLSSFSAVASVTLNHFRTQFFTFVNHRYSAIDLAFPSWYSMFGKQDFRQAINANVGYLWKEAYDLDTQLDQGLCDHPLWGEIDPKKLTAIPSEPSHYEKTVVTPFVYGLFRHMAFEPQLAVVEPTDDKVMEARSARRKLMGLTPLRCISTVAPTRELPPTFCGTVRKGDIVCIAPDMESTWNKTETNWYAYVQGVRRYNKTTKLDVLWLYHPVDTTLGHGHYPFKNELFLSDNCSCGTDAIDIEHVLGKIDVCWFASDPKAQDTFFVRQKFRTEHTFGAYDFVKLEKSDFVCQCESHLSDLERVVAKHTVGEMVLVQDEKTLNPAQIVDFCQPDTVTLRKLLRAHQTHADTDTRPNQLILTEDIYQVSASQIVRSCYVRLFADLSSVRAPYNCDGAGDYYFVLTDETVSNLPQSQQGEFPSTGIREALTGLSLFGGGGSLDRGLEEGGAVHFDYVVDWDPPALHTYRANLENPSKVHLFLGSVNDYIVKAMHGSTDPHIAVIGGVLCLVAGSPCPGYSSLQIHKGGAKALLMCSLVASVVSYVDFYTPNYLVLENVIGLASNPPDRKDQNAFSQILCALVAIGYQVQQFLVEPSCHGSGQSRARIFIVATAPDCKPWDAPVQTHTFPQEQVAKRKIGIASNGKPFGQRKNAVSPFGSMTARSVMEDLPDISEGHVRTCIPFPDHRAPKDLPGLKRQQITMIPRWPYGKGFVYAAEKGLMGKRQMDAYPWFSKHRASKDSKAWSRVFPESLIGCITTCLRPEDGINGRAIHWDQHRLLTVMEARRAQSIPDHEVIIGSPAEQWKIVGNGVDRKVAFALGLQLGKAWRKTLEERARRQQLLPLHIASAPPTEVAQTTGQVDGVDIIAAPHECEESIATPSHYGTTVAPSERLVTGRSPLNALSMKSPARVVPLTWTTPITTIPRRTTSTAVRSVTTTVQVIDLTDESDEPHSRRQSINVRTTVDLTRDDNVIANSSGRGCSRIAEADTDTKVEDDDKTPYRSIVPLPKRSGQTVSTFRDLLPAMHDTETIRLSTRPGNDEKPELYRAEKATGPSRTTATIASPKKLLPKKITVASATAQEPKSSYGAQTPSLPRRTAPTSINCIQKPTATQKSTSIHSAAKKNRHSAACSELHEFNQWGEEDFSPNQGAAVSRAPRRRITLRARESREGESGTRDEDMSVEG